MGTTRTIEPQQTGYNFPIDEKTTRCSRGKSSIHGTRHGKNFIPLHPRKDVESVKHHNIDYRHPKSTIELDIISTSTGHYSRSNCGNMRAEMTNHLTTQSMKTNNTRNNYLRQHTIEVPPLFLWDEERFCSWGRCWRSQSVSRLVEQPTNWRLGRPCKVVLVERTDRQLYVTICKSYILGH